MKRKLREIAYARSGDKGDSVNIGVIANGSEEYRMILKQLTAEKVAAFFHALNPKEVRRYELPNLEAVNFILEGVLDGGGMRNLRVDAQGKAFGQALLEIEMEM